MTQACSTCVLDTPQLNLFRLKCSNTCSCLGLNLPYNYQKDRMPATSESSELLKLCGGKHEHETNPLWGASCQQSMYISSKLVTEHRSYRNWLAKAASYATQQAYPRWTYIRDRIEASFQRLVHSALWQYVFGYLGINTPPPLRRRH